MFKRFLSKYGLGVHLGLLAAAPLALMPFLEASTLASVTLYLSALAGVWLLAEPSLRVGEHISLARARVRKEIVCDVFFWFLILVLLVAAFRMFNTGIALKYDPGQTIWAVGEAALGSGPACVEGRGFLPFSVVVAIIVVSMGLRHGIGLKARTIFGVSGSMFAGLGGLGAISMASAAYKPFTQWLAADFGASVTWPSSFGIWLVLALVCGAHAETKRWKFARVGVIIGVAGSVGAIIFFAPPLLAAVWLVIAFLAYAFSLTYLSRASGKGAVARNLSMTLCGLVIPFALMAAFVPAEVYTAKLDRFDIAVAFPELYTQSTEIFSRVSREMWVQNPWFGVGTGAYGLQLPFFADKADWSVIPSRAQFPLNGYWLILCERGIIGCLIAIAAFGILIATYFIRLVGAFFQLRKNDEADIFPFAVPPVAWCALPVLIPLAAEAFFAPVFLNDTLFLTIVALLAVSASAFPRAKQKPAGEAADKNSSEIK